MKVFITILLILFFSISFSQIMSEENISDIAKIVNDKLRGTDIGNGVVVRGCLAYGRTILYQYDVNEYWYPTESIKEDVIAYFKEIGSAEVFFSNDINLNVHYYFENKLLKKISIKSREFSDLSYDLGEYLSIKGHPKAKGVDLRIQPPASWDIEEGDRPNIVKKFVLGNNNYMILIKDNITFISRNEFREFLQDPEYVNDLIAETSMLFNKSEVSDYNIVTIDRYPTLLFTIKGLVERNGLEFNFVMKSWVVYYEDKIIFLQAGGLDNMEFYHLENLFNKITNSVIFPEQYNW